MNRLTRYIRKDFRNRIAVYIIPFVITIIMIISMSCYYTFYSAFKQEKLNSAQILIDQIGMQFDARFKTVKTPMSYITMNQTMETAMKRYQNMSIQEKYYLDKDMTEYLSNIDAFIDYVTDIIIVGNNGYTFNLPTAFRLDHEKFSQNKDWVVQYMNTNKTQFYYTLVHQADYYEQMGTSKKVVSVLLPIMYQGTNYGFIQADLDYEALNKQLYKVYSQEETSISIIDQDGTIIFDKEDSMLNQQLAVNIKENIHDNQGSFTVKTDGKEMLVVYQKLDITNGYLVARISYSAIFEVSNKVLKIICTIILPIAIILAVLFSVGISDQIRKPLNELYERVGQVDIKNYEYLEKDYGVDIINRLGEQFEDSFVKIKELIEEVYIADIRHNNAQYEILQKQITPHFMYNSLQLIKTEALISGNKEISEITTVFSNLLRYSFEKDVKWVTVEQEKSHIIDYLNIYHKRFPKKFEYQISIDRQILQKAMLKLILQPFVENSIKHGLKDISEGGIIKVNGYLYENDIYFEVIDNGIGIDSEKIKEIEYQLNDNENTIDNVGLINVHQRILIGDGKEYGIIKIESVPYKETKFTIKIRGNEHV